MLLDRPARRGGEDRKEGRQENQRHADPVDAEQIVDVEGRDPRLIDHRLHSGLTDGELPRAARSEDRRHRHPEREDEDNDRRRQADPADRVVLATGDQRQRQNPGDDRRQEEDERQGPEGRLRHGQDRCDSHGALVRRGTVGGAGGRAGLGSAGKRRMKQ